MDYESPSQFIRRGGDNLAKGPVALIFVEDEVEAEATLKHHLDAGFKRVIAFMAADVTLSADIYADVVTVGWDLMDGLEAHEVVNTCIKAAPDIWFYYCFNAEFLFFPFSESRSVGEMIAFNTEERRETILTYVVDLYATDLKQFPDGVSLKNAHLDAAGYYALRRFNDQGEALDRQMDFHGGLRWRLEEHVPKNRRKIDRVALFKSKAGLALRPDHTFNDEEYNTVSCPWHHNITAAICSFRTAKALKRNPGSRYEIDSFEWHNSVKFRWNSTQLMELGLMEPGQWF